ncbi:hypothetical protein OS493_012435 [Desmophyllum pertusum]|uniref:Uncharacterized protein n=1 Tax=Desmophyllum pertusum TaxID=174260 RepID=A0A9W9ZUA0_9CNID|nr:hypothetical protein OS493_012435 [Desmophyllum pertusum]
MDCKRIHTTANPMAESTIIGKFFTYWWMNDVFRKGYKRPLENSDIYEILPEDETKGLADKLDSLWNEELKDAQRKNKRPRLRNAFYQVLRIPLCYAGSFTFYGGNNENQCSFAYW